jgi:hypothetical protein
VFVYLKTVLCFAVSFILRISFRWHGSTNIVDSYPSILLFRVTYITYINTYIHIYIHYVHTYIKYIHIYINYVHTYILNVTAWAVSRRRTGKHVPTNAQPTIEGRPLLGNAWVDAPDNNTWYPLLSSWCVFCGWSIPSLYKKQWRLFDRIRQEDVAQGSSVVVLTLRVL